MYELLLQNQELIAGLVSAIIVWIIYRVWGVNMDKSKIFPAVCMVLDIIQDIKTGPKTFELSDAEKKKMAVRELERLVPQKKKNLLVRTFGSLGGAVEFVYLNRKSLWQAAAKFAKAVI